MNLIQDKLDVKNKTRANLFNWRGQFTPQFVDYILENFTHCANECIIDPFSGSGTVLLESSKRNLTSYGYEINPAAYAMSKFFTFANMAIDKRQELIQSVETKLSESLRSFEGLPVDKPNYRESYVNLTHLSQILFSKISDHAEKILVLNILFLSESRPVQNPIKVVNSLWKQK